MNAGKIVPYTTAEQMAAEYRDATAQLRAHIVGIGEQCDRLMAAFSQNHGYDFGIHLVYRSGHESVADDTTADRIISQMKLAAWSAIIDRLNIRRLMSSKRIAELDRALGRDSPRRYHDYGEKSPEFPEITPENIQQVAAGMLGSATEFLEEAIAEEYEFWRPGRAHAPYKRNSDWKLNRKAIQTYMVEKCGHRNRGFRCNYHRQSHITALDNIFHMLDGSGPVQSFKGPLAIAIETSESGAGETDYFKFRCYKNGNLHLEFKRKDLLDLFNSIAGKSDRIGQERNQAAS